MKEKWILATCVLMIFLAAAGAAQAGSGVISLAAYFGSDEAPHATPAAVVLSQVTHDDNEDTVAVQGISYPRPFYGIGGRFEGGWEGVIGWAGVAGEGTRTGVLGVGANAPTSYGVRGNAQNGTFNYGVLGSTSCDGSCTNYAVYASGDLAYTGSLLNVSDLRFKEDVAELGGGLKDLLELEVVTFQHKLDPEFEHMSLPRGPQVGFIAQQVAEVFPELVVEAVHPSKEDLEGGKEEGEPIRYQALKTVELIPILVKAIQEQQAQIEALRAQMAPLQHRLAELEGAAGGSGLVASAP